MKVVVDHGRCQGHAMCFNNTPELFELDDDGYNRMQPFNVSPDDEAKAKRAARLCPERAINILSDEMHG
jgi:ferredoxin